MTDEFRLDVVVRGDDQWVVVHGELDLATAPALDDALDARLEAGPGPVVIDLARCGFIDSTGVRSLVRFGDKARHEGRAVAIVSAPGSGSRFTLDLLGVGEAVPVHDSADSLARHGDQASSA